MKIEWRIPLRVVSEANLREHWAKSHKRKKHHRETSALICRSFMRDIHLPPKMRVTLTRYGKQTLDDDNLANGFKAVRDGIAEALGIDDGSDRIEWRYRQEKAKVYDVGVTIESI